jgi:hypothetical protein
VDEKPSPASPAAPETGTASKPGIGHNSNVFKILPLTTLRTIDLGGRKISGRLFSIFCGEMRVFFEVFSAPEFVQKQRSINLR